MNEQDLLSAAWADAEAATVSVGWNFDGLRRLYEDGVRPVGWVARATGRASSDGVTVPLRSAEATTPEAALFSLAGLMKRMGLNPGDRRI